MAVEPVSRLGPEHDLAQFDCGIPELNQWLVKFALSDERAGVSVTYILSQDGSVVGFYTLAPHAIQSDPESRLGRGQPRSRPIPVLLLARLGLDISVHGTGLGADLLRDALLRSLAASSEIGGRAIVVDANNDRAAEFYRRFGFKAMPDNPQLLYVMMDLRESVRAIGDD